MVKAIFSSSPLLLPLALQLGLSQPPPHFTLSQEGESGEGEGDQGKRGCPAGTSASEPQT